MFIIYIYNKDKKMKNIKYDLGLISGNVFIKDKFIRTSIGIKKGKIVHIGKINPYDCKEILKLKNKLILPGFIDTQVHFREPGLTHKEDLEHGTRSALLGGITTIFEMPNTSPATINKKELNRKIAIAKNKSWTNYSFFIGACKKNIKDLAKLEKIKGCAGIKIFMGSSTGTLLVSEEKDLELALKLCKRRVAIHSEDEERLSFRYKNINPKNGVKEHLRWRDSKSALLSTLKVIKYAKKYKTKAHILHVSTHQEMKILKDKIKSMTVEVTPQHLTLAAPNCYDKLGSFAQMNPPIRNKKHQIGLWHGIKDGTVDVIGSDHAPHTISEKKRSWPNSPSGMPGVQTTLPIMLNHVNKKKLSIKKLIKLMSENPCKIYKIKNKGYIKKGFDADFTVIDMNKKIKLENKNMASKSGWTPFSGMTIKGFPIATIVNGEIKMYENKIIGKPNGKVVDFE